MTKQPPRHQPKHQRDRAKRRTSTRYRVSGTFRIQPSGEQFTVPGLVLTVTEMEASLRHGDAITYTCHDCDKNIRECPEISTLLELPAVVGAT
jgi:hypothetical protein